MLNQHDCVLKSSIPIVDDLHLQPLVDRLTLLSVRLLVILVKNVLSEFHTKIECMNANWKVESLGYLLQDFSICPFLLSENPLWWSQWTTIPGSIKSAGKKNNDEPSKSFKLRFWVLNIQQRYRQVRWWPISPSCNTCPAWRASSSSKNTPTRITVIVYFDTKLEKIEIPFQIAWIIVKFILPLRNL